MGLHAVYEVGHQGVLIDTGHRSDLEAIERDIENCNYSFKYGTEYIAVPVFEGKRKPHGYGISD